MSFFNSIPPYVNRDKLHPGRVIVVIIGFILSPLTFWNDLFVNVPLAYVLAYPIGMINGLYFLYAFVFAYWMTNLIGLLMLHLGLRGLVSSKEDKPDYWRIILTTLSYTIIIVILSWLNFIPSPEELQDWMNTKVQNG